MSAMMTRPGRSCASWSTPFRQAVYLTLSDGANTSKAREQAHQRYAQTGAVPYKLRSPGQIAAFFDGLELLEPGIVPVSQWRPDPSPFGPPRHVDTFGGVARKG